MFEGWDWRYSRQVELAAMVAAVIGNRIPLNESPVEYEALTRGWRHYREDE